MLRQGSESRISSPAGTETIRAKHVLHRGGGIGAPSEVQGRRRGIQRSVPTLSQDEPFLTCSFEEAEL